MHSKRHLIFLLLVYVSGISLAVAEPDALNDLSIEDLLKSEVSAVTQKEHIKKRMLNVKVSSVAKDSQSQSNAAAAVYVIDQATIARSGVTNVPDALRLAPGIDVARINNSKWAVTARGFNGRFANKLLVLIDGRSVYTPDFSGVYWDAQDVMLEDVDRIEVIRGPGATLWGANAMNGVINIITKHTEDTQGGLLTGGSGTQENGFGGLRYGGKLAEDTYARAYAKGFMREEFTTEKASSGYGDWEQFQGGFRVDSTLSAHDNLMLQANAYSGTPKQHLETFLSPVFYQDAVKTYGGNVTSRFNHSISSTANYTVQLYYDYTHRDEFSVFNDRDTADIDVQNTFALTEQQSVIWGLGYRYSQDAFRNTPLTLFTRPSAYTQLFSGFVQDEVSFLNDALIVTLGSKFEHNDYTGFEFQPSASVMWTPASGHKLWGSISRAVRTPSRVEDNTNLRLAHYAANTENDVLTNLGVSTLPFDVNINVLGNANYKAEQQLSYQLGYRLTFNNDVSLDITGFYNDYKTLRSVSAGSPNYKIGVVEIPYLLTNFSAGDTYGFELSQVWQMLDWWRWDLNYSYLKTTINSADQYPVAISPESMFSLRAGLNPMDKFTLDMWLRYVSSAEALNLRTMIIEPIPSYVSADIRLGYKPINSLELSIAGQNLLQDQHLEYFEESYALPSGVPRGVYGKIEWHF